MSTVTPRNYFAPEEGLGKYLRNIREYPILAAEEETDLARRWLSDRDDSAAHSLVNSHLRLVAKIAMGFRGYGLPVADLISEGNLGLMQAVQRFDPEKGCRFATYAMWWIRAAIQEYILHNWSMVKIGTTAAQKKLFFNLRRAKAELQSVDEGDLSIEHVQQIATRLDVPHDEVINMNRRLSSSDASLNAPLTRNGEDFSEWQDWLVDERESQETTLADKQELEDRRRLLAHALVGLSERERHIFKTRRLDGKGATLEELSNQYGISRERVRQIEVRAFEKIQKSVRSEQINRHVNMNRGFKHLQAA